MSDLEAAVWRHGAAPEAIAAYRAALPRAATHDFVVVIPVADRPGQLRAVLASLLAQCRDFAYGGVRDGVFAKVRALIADDSAAPEHVAANRALAAEFSAAGLRCEHFDAAAQHACLARVPDRDALARLLGPGAEYPHKGASVSRNLAYLRLAELARPARLFFFVDSDQEFRVRVPDAGRGRDVSGFSYFHTLDRIFATGEVDVLTGKVVGDPPVSPAVMAGNFLDDVRGFLDELAGRDPAAPCAFHHAAARSAGDAAYHDMAGLFGFAAAAAFRYRCARPEGHDNAAALEDFAARLDRFFDGEHPTRLSHFDYTGPLVATAPARTVYTGNYVFRAAALADAIPFASLKLRMAGPVLGRLLKARLGPRFVSANLPLLHARTHDATGRAEFRPGVARAAAAVDLSGEFERQFFGDVLLFTVEALIAAGFPEREPDAAQIAATLDRVLDELGDTYARQRRATLAKHAEVAARWRDPDAWWRHAPLATLARVETFLANVEANFGDAADGVRRIGDPAHRAQRRAQLLDALCRYRDDRAAWGDALARFRGER